MVSSNHNEYSLSVPELRELAHEVFDDYESNSGPFKEYELPEYDVIYEVPAGRERANFITLVATINLNVETSGEEGLWQTALDAYESEHFDWIFDVETVAETDQLDLYTEAFKRLGWNSNNAHVFWGKNATTIAEEFNGDVRNLLDHCSNDGVEIQSYLQDEKPDWFPSLKGDKVSALWLRLIHEEIQSLNAIEEISIPADRNILRVTDFLQSDDFSERTSENLETTRNLWEEVCAGTDLVPVYLDKPLWLCGKGLPFNYWNRWGQEYLETKIESL